MAMYFSSEIGVDSLRVGLNIASEILEHFKGGFAIDYSWVFSLEEGVLVFDRACHDVLLQ